MKLLEGLSLNDFDLADSDWTVSGKTLLVLKQSWDYEHALRFQEEMTERVWHNKDESVFISCSHPTCLTLGKGLQKIKDPAITLIDFDETIEQSLPVKIHRIKRGGGITFHHPRQFVFYPILNLEKNSFKVFDFLMLVLEEMKGCLEDVYNIQGLKINRELLGLWHGDKKIASIGLSARKFVSYHGLALNMDEDKLTNEVLQRVYPCGLPGTTYGNLKEILGTEGSFSLLSEQMVKRIQKHL